MKPRQPSLPLAPRQVPRETVAPFEFEPGPEAVPRPDWVPPEWLTLPTDDPEWRPTQLPERKPK